MSKTIVFDFDGSLVNSWPVILDVFNEMSEKYGFNRLSDDDFQRFKSLDTRELLKAYKIPLIKALKIKKEGGKLFAAKSDKVKVFMGMREVLITLKEMGYKLGILTFSPEEVVHKVLKEQELEMFDFVYCVPGFKSKTKSFKKMLKEQNIDKQTLIYVGDELRDIELAREFNVKVVSVSWGYNTVNSLSEKNPDALVSDVSDLLSAIRKLV